MLNRSHVQPFLRIEGERVHLTCLPESTARLAFIDRLLRLLRRLEGRELRYVREALRRQERRVRDVTVLDGVARTLLDACEFRAPAGAARAADVRHALFATRGSLWPPVPGDDALPYETAALMLDMTRADVERLLYADAPSSRALMRSPRHDARGILDRYNIGLARAVLLDAESVTVRARGGWRNIFRAVKLARLMYTLERAGRSRRAFQLTLTGPTAPYIMRPQRYGIRFGRVLPSLIRAPSWQLDATLRRDGRTLHFHADAGTLPIRPRRGRPRYDSRFESGLAAEFASRIGDERDGWTLTREDVPVVRGPDVFLPDFTVRHRDGREALVEIVGFWTPEYLEEKLRKVRAAALDNLVLVVYRGLAAARDDWDAAAPDTPIVWFTQKPRIGPVMEAVERVAKRG